MKIIKFFAILTCFDAYTISGISRRSRLKGDIYFKASRPTVKQEVAKIAPGQLKCGAANLVQNQIRGSNDSSTTTAKTKLQISCYLSFLTVVNAIYM